MNGALTVFDILRSLFPIPSSGSRGKRPFETWPGSPRLPLPADRRFALSGDALTSYRRHYWAPPWFPFDMFAATGHLLELSGAYHHVVPALRPRRLIANLPEKRANRIVRITEAQLRICKRIGRNWRQMAEGKEADDGSTAEEIVARRERDLKALTELWHCLLVEFGNAPIFTRKPPINLDPKKNQTPRWWHVALQLFIIADEAAAGFGLQKINELTSEEMNLFAMTQPVQRLRQRLEQQLDAQGAPAAPSDEVEDTSFITTLSVACPDMVAVVPKARTTPVGCTLRSLSHHLALLPARGIARANWIPNLFGDVPPAEQQFNMLLVPYPFSIAPHHFMGQAGLVGTRQTTGLFKVRQAWLEAYRPSGVRGEEADHLGRLALVDHLANFIYDLASEARVVHKSNDINAIVFPEYALSHSVFALLQQRLVSQFPGLELLVSGLSQGDDGREGNFVAVSSIARHKTKDDAEPEVEIITTIREKHHRWRLDAGQINAYGLGSVLNAGIDWWEDIDLMSRRVDFTVFRRNSVLSAMICEDLARVDPCQELLRAVGPNLVIALLMDGPQLPTRWPARYATILSEDPGCSVLSITSRALMTLQHLNGRQPSTSPDDRVIGLWRDDAKATPEPIKCPNDCHGVWLRVFGLRVSDISFDGRDDIAISWRYGGQKPLAIADVNTRYGPLLGRQDRALRSHEPWDRGD